MSVRLPKLKILPIISCFDFEISRVRGSISQKYDLSNMFRISAKGDVFVKGNKKSGSLLLGIGGQAKGGSQESEVRSQEPEVRSQESGVRRQESGDRRQESGVRSQESGVRSQGSGARSQESGVRGQKSEVRSQESEVRSQESEVRRQRFSVWSGEGERGSL